MNKSEYDELKWLIDEYDKADEGNDALGTMLCYLRRWIEKYEYKNKISDERRITYGTGNHNQS